MKYKLLAFLFVLGLMQLHAQTTIDCANGPLDLSYCYENNDTNQFSYTSSDGSSLRLTINSGTIEGIPFDFLVILDTDGVTELYNGEGNNGVLDGLLFQSTGDTISFQINSDASVSCASDSGCCIGGIDYTVSCSTCANPQANFEAVGDCDNGDQFLVNVDITSLGDANSLTVSNSIDANTFSVSEIGIYQVGPFSNSSQVIVTLQNDQDENCSIVSNQLEFLFCPPENDDPCDAMVLSSGTDEQCNLFASATITGATDSGIGFPSCMSNANDDVWFQFTALAESQIISIENVTGGAFDLDHALYEGTCTNLIEIYCSESINSAASQLTIGSTYFIRVFSAGDEPETSNFDLCLKDAPSNIICDEAVPFCSDNGVLIGSNTTGITGLNDVACLASSPNPKWSTIQIGETGPIDIEIEQTDGNNNLLDVDFAVWGPFTDLDGACATLDFGCPTSEDCPNNTTDPNFYPSGNIISCSYSFLSVENFTIEDAQAGEIYILLVTNFSDSPGIITITQTNLNEEDSGVITTEIEVDLGPDLNICESENNAVTLGSEVSFADSYEWYYDGSQVASGPTEYTYVATESGSYSVIIYNENCDVFAQDDIQVSFVNCDDVGLINVSSFYDANENGALDTNETNFTNGYFTYEINDDGVINTVASSTGSFTLASILETDTYDFNYYLYDEYQDCYDVSIASFEDISALAGENVVIEFPIIDELSCEDIAVYLINQQSPRPGFLHNNYLVIDNLGLLSTSGSVAYVVDPGLVINSISSGTNYTITLTANGFILDFIDLIAGQSINVLISLETLTTTNIGDLVTNSATYITAENDIVSDNNSSTITELVTGSYDPNNKMESHGRDILYNDFVTTDEYLYYTIRFQNLGTAAADFVRIDDALNSQLDETTFQMLRSSHDYVVTRTDNDLEWFFDTINLPAEQDDAEGSQGFVYFKIKPKSGYAIGDIIPNTASIVFDFNTPIITNTYETEFVEENLSVTETGLNVFDMFPNPANDNVTIRLNTNNFGNVTINIIDLQGKLILEQHISEGNTTELDIADLQNGLYFVKLNANNKNIVKKLIIE